MEEHKLEELRSKNFSQIKSILTEFNSKVSTNNDRYDYMYVYRV